MNPHRKFKNHGPGGFGLVLMVLAMCFVVFVAIVVEPTHKKNTEKLSKLKPIDRTKIVFTNVSGNVESIHPWGRTEIVPMKEVELEYFQYCDEWVMYGDVIQPVDRKNYFMPVMKGHLDLNVNETTTTWVEYGKYWTGLSDDEKSYEDFRLAHIKVMKGRVVNIKYTHYRLDSNRSWSIIASWEAGFSEQIGIPK
jgi:hypothetical protein